MSQPICVFPQGITLNISYSYMHGVEKVALNSNKLAIKLDGYASAEKDYDSYYDSYEVVAYPELALVDAFDNELVNIYVDSETPEALQYFIIAGTKGNLYIKDYTLDVDEEAKTGTLKFHELHQGNPIEIDPEDAEEVNLHFTANARYSNLSNMDVWKKCPYSSTSLATYPEEGEIVVHYQPRRWTRNLRQGSTHGSKGRRRPGTSQASSPPLRARLLRKGARKRAIRER